MDEPPATDQSVADDEPPLESDAHAEAELAQEAPAEEPEPGDGATA
jgi:hypothetical protein